jgi:hypothetical protein
MRNNWTEGKKGGYKMRMQILRNPKGEVIAMFERTLDALVSTEPEVSEGEELVEVELPDEYIRMPAPDSIKRLQADIQAKRLEIKPKKQ